MSSNIIQVNEKDFEQTVLGSKAPAVVDFWAPWCSPCLRLAPAFDAAAARHAKAAVFFKLNIDDNPALVGRYGIQSIPTLILFQDGVERERLIGTVGGEEIAEMIRRHTRVSAVTESAGAAVAAATSPIRRTV